MTAYSEVITRLISALESLPGIGPKSAERIIFHILKTDEAYACALADAIVEVKKKIFFCEICFNLSEKNICHICSNPSRNHEIICVVEEPKDVIAIEKAGGYNGVYHVLLGALSAINGIGPSKLKIEELFERIHSGAIEEVILATNPNADGDATALYLSQLLAKEAIKISRISRGVPLGSSFEYLDQATIACALRDRQPIHLIQ
ncbi:MAG: recombination protein RecR [Candidatus Omnitrophica bacterium]|nr:recombination protein RecR [Candidatus Omnitrophota bacterium]